MLSCSPLGKLRPFGLQCLSSSVPQLLTALILVLPSTAWAFSPSGVGLFALNTPVLDRIVRSHECRPLRHAGGIRGLRAQGLRDEDSKSVGDAVGFVHGGKYQFDSRASQGMGVAADYSGEASKVTVVPADGGSGQDEVPSWAQDFTPGQRTQGSATLNSANLFQAEVELVNQEISWEPFYAKVINGPGLSVFPESGTLAPRGGANNVCDESKPYPDSCRFKIQMDPSFLASGVTGDVEAFLVVRTEQETFTWILLVQTGL